MQSKERVREHFNKMLQTFPKMQSMKTLHFQKQKGENIDMFSLSGY